MDYEEYLEARTFLTKIVFASLAISGIINPISFAVFSIEITPTLYGFMWFLWFQFCKSALYWKFEQRVLESQKVVRKFLRETGFNIPGDDEDD
jgi:hypothetical protein